MEPAELAMAGKASVFLVYLEAMFSAEPFFLPGPPEVRIAPNGASYYLLANSAWLSLKKTVRCTCFPFWEHFHVLLSLLWLCTYKLSLLLGRGAGSFIWAPSGIEEFWWVGVCRVTHMPHPLSICPWKPWHPSSCLQAARLALDRVSRAAAAGSRPSRL